MHGQQCRLFRLGLCGGLGGLGELWGVRGVVGMAGKVFGGCLSALGGWRVATGPFTSGGITVVKCANNL